MIIVFQRVGLRQSDRLDVFANWKAMNLQLVLWFAEEVLVPTNFLYLLSQQGISLRIKDEVIELLLLSLGALQDGELLSQK